MGKLHSDAAVDLGGDLNKGSSSFETQTETSKWQQTLCGMRWHVTSEGRCHTFLLANEELLNEKMVKCNGSCHLPKAHDDLDLKK